MDSEAAADSEVADSEEAQQVDSEVGESPAVT